ncbi:MAG: hypothetical protein FWH26_00380 [Oscillospiraceae bacterium]|nr:hypothetical protein [Oscillospiraceae bacterium]
MKRTAAAPLCAILLACLCFACGKTPETAYAPIIEAYENLIRGGDAEAFMREAGVPVEFGHQADSSCFEILLGGKEDLGYAIYDINGDGVMELMILSRAYYDIHALFTLRGDTPVMLGAYWSRSRCVIDTDGRLYYMGSGGADDTIERVYTLAPGGTSLRVTEEGESGIFPADNPTRRLGLTIVPIP